MKVLLVAGARPNFMKIAPLYREGSARPGVECLIVHTGQHYDHEMSGAFFSDLEIPEPAFRLDAGSGSHAVQTARIMVSFEQVCMDEQPDLVIVVGDVNSTLACSIVGKKLQIRVAHVEAGLRSFDTRMPEEINRMVTDSISDWFFVTEESGTAHLLREGKPPERIHEVGHVMIDNLFHQLGRLRDDDPDLARVREVRRGMEEFAFLTLHRPSNVDDRATFEGIVRALNEISEDMPIIFPVHPRTRKMMEEHRAQLSQRIVLLPPLGFREALYLWKDAALVVTDSGGLQEETTALGVPCLTVRENTERPVTITHGSNILAGTATESILNAYRRCRGRRGTTFPTPPLWDGKASQRIWDILVSFHDNATECQS
ncbi:UDP-N-acetylglucosamine 2-epimerase [Geobacter sulfurreducens]|nr:UDP-N-acetylglucosamine 2-epimerase [Geobacter sulfurreducens]